VKHSVVHNAHDSYFAKFFLFMILPQMLAMTQFICPVSFQLSHQWMI